MQPTVSEVLPLVRALYRRHAAGCCLHIVLDDCNVDDEHVDYCIGFAEQEMCFKCVYLAERLRQMTRRQRRKLANGDYGSEKAVALANLYVQGRAATESYSTHDAAPVAGRWIGWMP